ncbi:unnamed protein product [Cylicocyclus nassatus]|uniref:OTU domain-containing protein n=1 Tax=Cylicocyclus nassatus TaxID=53992 RepID=A0AA36HBK7_CYLNA|nr:unnamed protein product [Cylicocyclus nassatus]
MHEASTKSKNDASPSDAVKAQLASRLEQQPSCSRQNLSQSIELNEQSNERPLPRKSLSKKSLETVKERTQRKKVEGKTSGDSNVRADEHKLALLQLDAERCRSNRWRETERQRAERLAKVAERARKRRSTETDEERMLRLRKFAERKRQRAHEGLENEISEGVKRNSTLSSERLENKITVDPEHSRALTLTPSETTVASITDEAEIDLSQQRSEYGFTTSPLMQNVTANGHLSETQRSTVEHEEGCLNENASVIYAPMIAPPEFVAVSSKDSETPLLIGNDENTSPYPYSATEAGAITNENNLLTYRRNHNEEERGDNVPVNQIFYGTIQNMYTNYGAEDVEDEVDPMEELLAQHRKEKKALKEKALSMKKIAKSGNKQKQKETNAEIERLESEMAARHEREISNLKLSLPAATAEEKNSSKEAKDEVDEIDQAFYKEVQVSSRNKKKQAKKEEALRRMQEAVEKDRENAANSLRVTEMTAIQKILDERGLSLVDIAPDGDCLYNAVANQLSRVKGYEQVTGKDMRRRAAKYMRENKEDFVPFLTNESDEPLDEFEFEKYCAGVENESKDGGVWGGEPELNALSRSLERSIELLQPVGPPVIFGENYKNTKPLIIVYHRHAYKLGAHYNSTAIKTIS